MPVVVTIDGGYQYRNTISSMGGRFLLSFSHQREHAETRARRVANTIERLRA